MAPILNTFETIFDVGFLNYVVIFLFLGVIIFCFIKRR